MTNMKVDLEPAELLTAIHNQLNRRFFQTRKNDAKQLFLAIQSGKEIPFMEIAIADRGEVHCHIALDCSLFDGKLNFGLFRNALAVHLHRVADKLGKNKLDKKESLNTFTNEETGDRIFHIPGVIEAHGKLNILVTGISQREPGKMTICLMFLDPAEFDIGPAEEPS